MLHCPLENLYNIVDVNINWKEESLERSQSGDNVVAIFVFYFNYINYIKPSYC